jgi:rhodanese-related sulfurtransferase
VQATKKKLDAGEKMILVDTREESEWARGHIPNALHLGKGVIERDIEKAIPDKETTLVLYCGGGYRSALAADNLQKMGYRNVISMDGGWRGWTEAGFPTIRD